MKTITLPADTEHLYLDELAHLIADYFNPEGPNDPDGVRYELDKIQAKNEVHQAAKDDSLSVKHPGTHGPFPLELGLKRAVVLVPDMVAYLATRGIAVVIAAPKQEAAAPAPVGAVGASDGNEPWKVKARERAIEIIKRDRAKSLYPSQINLADEIAKEFRRDGVMGTDGKPLASGYIKRWALNGISSAQSKQLSTLIRRGK